MDWVLYPAFSWFIITYFIANIKEKNRVKDVIIYMILMFFISISTGIISTNMNLITINHEKIKFFEVLLHRLVVTPFLLLILVSKYDRFKESLQKSASVIFALASLALFEFLNIKLQLYRYMHWNAFFSLLLNSFFIFIALTINRYFNVLKEGASK
jgi:ABC-type proline/glycine betaine transport system permease subunit